MSRATDAPDRPAAPTRHGSSFLIARIAGIDLRVHFTFLILVALFGAAAPDPGVVSALVSVGWLLAIFACVVIHEFAHSVMARSRGVEVHEILLLPLGGISKLERLPENPADEFAIAIVGPLASLGLAGGAAAVCIATGRSLIPIDLIAGAWFAKLAWLNLILAAFNLLPAFPLDGGRVFRAQLERTHDLESATRIATRVGHFFALLLVAIGVFFDVWLILIGLFVYFGASAEQAGTITHLRLRGHTLADAMRGDVDRIAPGPWEDAEAVTPGDPLSDELIARLSQAIQHQLPVRRDDVLVGVLRVEDVNRLVAAG